MKKSYQTVRDSGGRLTKIKKAIIDVLCENRCLLTKAELVEKLKAQKISPNRSTIYRELQFLTEHGVIIKNTILGVDHYEIPQDHHHHLVCLKCHQVSQVKMGNQLEKQAQQIAAQNKFNIINHSLEFNGHCHQCQA